METLPILGGLLASSPALFGLVLFALTPGMHILLSSLAERRRVNTLDDYLAVLIGDPLLAVAGAIGVALADGRYGWMASRAFGSLAITCGLLWGYAQSRQEERRGTYTRAQILSPSKLWHQYIVYPVEGYLVPAATISGLRYAGDNLMAAVVLICCVLIWAYLAVDAMRHPRLGHGAFDWRKLRATPVTVARPGTVDRRNRLRG